MKTFTLTIVLGLIFSIVPTKFNAQYLKENNEIIVAYYGRPGVSSLGVLGQHSPTELGSIIKAKVAEYEKADPGAKVIPAFDIIYDLASASPGAKGDYIIPLGEGKLDPYIEMAEKEGFLLFIDLQLGKKSPIEAVRPMLKYLSHKNVHLAIDPEFEVKGLTVAPGKVIGHINGTDVNEVQAAMQDYVKKNNITEEKFLMVHNFTKNMVKGKDAVKDYNGINLIMNLDGHGGPALKINIYNGLYNKNVAARVDGGFKLFFKEDHPMMTPSEVLGKSAAGKVKIKYMPRFINYQ